MRASYPAKSQTLRPGVGPPTESKAQKQTEAPTARSGQLFGGSRASQQMRASYPAKSKTLRPGVGPPTESKAQKQTKAPTPAVTCFFLWEPRPRGECGLPTQPRAKRFAPGSGLPQNQKPKSKPKRPPLAATCFFVGGAPSRRCGRQPANRTTQSAQPDAADKSNQQSHLPAHTRSPLRAAIPEPADNHPAPPP